MAGHSKFSNIKHKKERADAVKGKIFTKLGREIAVAVKSGGPDPASNMTLKNIILKAKASNMPNDTIDRSIKKAGGDPGAINYDSVIYEGYGPNGVAVMAEALTDNKNRAAANVRNAFTKGGGSIGAMGCVSYMFARQGVILIEAGQDGGLSADGLMELALDAGAEDFIAGDDGYEILTGADGNVFGAVSDALSGKGIQPVSAEITMVPAVYVSLTDAGDLKRMNKLLELLDDEDDVTNVYHNWEQ
ncbi:MAG: YebC/PmpR family DNA-binding transcriptional regulator [Defluviitaleaceae bacterium]|nr:YebC/PmpR family DNA-binding transcriptional regulator [Defluviitaleaceae bacterium]MCL2835131.1 YebC/PmpR family DNA-binding transcriptional regulator [Defluviitaleaceae bacterium]